MSENPIIVQRPEKSPWEIYNIEEGQMIYVNRAVEPDFCHVHSHNFIEIAYVAGGKGIHRIDGKEYAVSKGDLFIINYDVPHEFRSTPSSKVVIQNCIFKPEFIDASLIRSHCFTDLCHIFLFNSLFKGELPGNDIKLLGKDTAEIEDIYRRMYLEYTTRGYGYIEILRAYVVELLVKIFRFYEQSGEPERIAKDKACFDSVIRFMKEHYTQEIKLDELAAMTFLSRNYFCSVFKECTGLTVMEYVQNLRVEEACRLLNDDTLKIIDIAEKVGYRDLKFFNKIFKKITGKTPREYRSAHKPA